MIGFHWSKACFSCGRKHTRAAHFQAQPGGNHSFHPTFESWTEAAPVVLVPELDRCCGGRRVNERANSGRGINAMSAAWLLAR